MGRSIGSPSVFTEGRIVHKLSGSTVKIQRRGDVLEHVVERRGLAARYPVAWSVGAGIVGYSYMVRLGPFLFQSPATYYTQTQKWDLTPGYEIDSHLDFTHQIVSGCLFCHTGSVNFLKGTANQFADPPFTAISCERCHGSSAAHLKDPVPGSIVNPAKLSGALRDSVCEQCHLEGVVRILNPGRDWWDFEAGEATENVFATYLTTANDGTLRAVSHSELLAQSACARESGGRLWCGTCHNPHSGRPNDAQAMRAVCLSCHTDLFSEKGHVPANECVSCHMPRLNPTNVAHALVTDHSIPRSISRTSRRQPPEPAASDPHLRAWRDPAPNLIRRNLGLAYFDLAANTHSGPALRQSYEILSHLPPEQRQDPPVEADLASVLLEDNQLTLAIRLYARAAAQQPSNARYAYVLGTALGRSGKIGDAIKELRRSIALDPSQPDPYLELARIYQATGQPAESRGIIEEYLRFMPQNLRLRSEE
jgi:predicted CXXCH cytochrome family protein